MIKSLERRRFLIGSAVCAISVSHIGSAILCDLRESSVLYLDELLPPNLNSTQIATLAFRNNLISMDEVIRSIPELGMNSFPLLESNKVEIRNKIKYDFTDGSLLIIEGIYLSKTEVLIACIKYISSLRALV